MAAAYAALVSARNIIDNLQHHPSPPISLPIKQFEYLTQTINSLLKFLQGHNPHRGYSKEADPLECRIADAAYAAEHAIESHIFDHLTNNGENMSYDALDEALEKVIQDMASIEEEADQIRRRIGVQNQLHTKSTPPDSSRSSSVPQQSSMVGVDDVKHQMMDKLTSHCSDLQIIPIVGMGGSGKTTLARTIYEERFIKDRFDICAWATISQEYITREIFEGLLRQFNIKSKKKSSEDKAEQFNSKSEEKLSEDKAEQFNSKSEEKLSEDDLGEKLYKHLYGRRYLIIMDDMWSIHPWDRVRNYFPNNENGSRIVVTTRLSDLASTLANSNSLGMELLDEAKSWELLSKTVFGKERCPLELEEIGNKIGKSCKGLPLSIVVVGGLLAKSKHTRECWEDIWRNLNASVVNLEDDKRCLKILYTSYDQLSIHLKPCFLYMRVFPEDEKIVISDLIKFWVAEGFLEAESGKSLEEIAKEYLKDLIDRNLVLRSTRTLEGKKCCQIHDLLRDLCLREAQKERFYNTSAFLPPMAQARHSLSLLRIVKTTALHWDQQRQLDKLVNSRYLQIDSYEIRKWNFAIWLFWNLQTLIVDTGNEVITAPIDFWYMHRIRHVEFKYGLRLPDPSNDQDDIALRNLQSMGKVLDFKCSKQVVKKIRYIKKMVFYNGRECDDDMHCLSNLSSLTELESLHCTIISIISAINFPNKLKRLVLRIDPLSYWSQDILDKIGALPHLQKLTLERGRFNEGKWEITEDQFCSLKFLTLDCSNLKIWNIESSHFPYLERLHLILVMMLREIPLDFAEIPMLREIFVDRCRDSVVVSAKRISEDHEDYCGEGALQVRVYLNAANGKELESLDSPYFRIKRYY